MGPSLLWGGADYGGDSSAVQDQLRGVQQIQATTGAFAAILEDGSIITWGGADYGGDSSAVRDQLRGVQQITAVCEDCGGDSAAVERKGGLRESAEELLRRFLEREVPLLRDRLAEAAEDRAALQRRTLERVRSSPGFFLRPWLKLLQTAASLEAEVSCHASSSSKPRVKPKEVKEVPSVCFHIVKSVLETQVFLIGGPGLLLVMLISLAVFSETASLDRTGPVKAVLLEDVTPQSSTGDEDEAVNGSGKASEADDALTVEVEKTESQSTDLEWLNSSYFDTVLRDEKINCPKVAAMTSWNGRLGNHIHQMLGTREIWKMVCVVGVGRLSLMLKINVVLPNGHAELLTLLPSSTVQDVRTKAQQAFGKKHLRLITAKNRVLADFEQTLEEAEIKDGECLAVLVLQPQLAATRKAFALWCHGNSAIVTWGDTDFGSDSSAVQDQLRGVQQIRATPGAFAAILDYGSVVTWGEADSGGDSSAVRDQLWGVQQIQATAGAFAAILEDGSVVTWGEADNSGGDSWAVRYQLTGVQQIQATGGAFAAILEDGSVITWGSEDYGGDSSAVQDQLRGVQQIQATGQAFVEILEDEYFEAGGAFAAILEDGSVITWGDANSGGDSSAVEDQLRGVQQIQATSQAFAAILADGSVVTWGDRGRGGDSLGISQDHDAIATRCFIEDNLRGYSHQIGLLDMPTALKFQPREDIWKHPRSCPKHAAHTHAWFGNFCITKTPMWIYHQLAVDFVRPHLGEYVQECLNQPEDKDAQQTLTVHMRADDVWKYPDYSWGQPPCSMYEKIIKENKFTKILFVKKGRAPCAEHLLAVAEAANILVEYPPRFDASTVKKFRMFYRDAHDVATDFCYLIRARHLVLSFSTFADYTVAISSCNRATMWHYACLLFCNMESAYVEVDLLSCSAAISACEKGRQWQLALVLFRAMPEKRVDQDATSYDAAISACEKSRQWQQALALFEEMPKVKISHDVISYNASMSALEKGGQWQQALAIFESMPKARIIPDVVSYSAIISACEKGDCWQSALNLFEKMPQARIVPDVVAYSSLISAFEKGCQWQQALGVLHAMARASITPNVVSYSASISACEKGGQWEQALAIFESMPKAKIIPNVVSYSAIISACEKGGQWQVSLALFVAMSQVSIPPNVVSYSAIISACEKGGQWQVSLALFVAMSQVSIPPNVVSYSAIISACEKGGQWQVSLALFVAMSQVSIPPNVVSYSAIISACEKGGQWQVSLALFVAMSQVSIPPNVVSYSAIISACEKGGQWQQALAIFQSMPKAKIIPNVVSYSAIISACEKGDCWQSALNLFERMPQARVCPNIVSCSAVISSCVKACRWQQALSYFDGMPSARIHPDVISYSSVIFACEQGGQLQRALALLTSMALEQL
eukprot:symbB.v1.2.027641.t1/scaffold2850.1/size68925/3